MARSLLWPQLFYLGKDKAIHYGCAYVTSATLIKYNHIAGFFQLIALLSCLDFLKDLLSHDCRFLLTRTTQLVLDCRSNV